MGSKIQRELAFLLTGKDVSASQAMKGVDHNITSLERHAGKAARNIGSNIERGVVLGVTAAAGATGYALQTAMDFQTSSTSVRKTVEGNADAVIEANRAMSRSFGFNVNDLNEIAAAGGAMDIPVDDLDEFTKTVAMLAETAQDVPTDLGAEALGHLRTNLQLTGPELVEVGDLVTHLGNNGASTEGEILAMAEAISGAAGIVDASKEDVFAWASAMASAGEEAEAGGSAIQRVWIDSARWIAEGGDQIKTLAKVSGKTVAQFEKDFAKDAPDALAQFITKLGALDDGDQLLVLKELGWDDIRITRAMTKLLGNTDNLNGAINETENAAGAMGREFEKRLEDAAQQFKILKANVDDAAITVGTELLPELVALSREGTDWLQGHQPEIKAFAKDLAEGIRDAVTWARSLDWEAIGSALGAGASAAKLLVEAFTNAPSWLQQVLVGAYVGNKLTGGVGVDIGGEILKGMIRGKLGITAGVVHVNGPVVGGGAPGAGGGSGFLAALGPAALVTGVGFAITEAMFVAIPQFMAQQPWFTPEANVGPGSEVDTTQLYTRWANAYMPPSLRQTNPESTVNPLSDAEVKAAAAFDTHSEQLAQTRALEDLRASLTPLPGDTRAEGIATRDAIAAVQAGQDDALVAFRDGERATSEGFTQSTAAATAATAGVEVATNMSAARIVTAIQAARPVITTNTYVNVSPTDITKATTTSERYGPSTGSSGSGSNQEDRRL